MPEFVTLSCPSCGAKLQIGSHVDRFACSHCGNEHVVRRDGGIISLAPVIEQIKQVQNGVDKTASELAITRLKEEIQDIRRSMPDTSNEGCLAKLGMGLSGIAMFACIGGIMTGEGGTIAMAVVVSLIMFAVGVWLGIKEDQNKNAKLKPYREAIAEKENEIKRHKKLVDLD